MGRELLEGDHRLRTFDPVEPGEMLRHDLGEVVVLPHSDDGDEVPVARDRVNLRHTFDGGEIRPQVSQTLPRGLDEDESCQHRSSVSVTSQGSGPSGPGVNPGPPTTS